MDKFVYNKPNIDSKKKLDKGEQRLVEKSLKEEGRILVHKELKHAKNDYKDDKDRGTVEYTPKCRNYSFHKVEIPDGTTIERTNFTQYKKRKAIIGENLTFIRCNLINNTIDSSWTTIGCNTAEVDLDALVIEEEYGDK